MSDAAYFVQYHQRLLALNPIACWLLDEREGTIAWDRSRNGRHGAHANVTLWGAGVGDQRPACSYDGMLAYTDVYSAGLAGAFDGQEGSLLIWAQVPDDGAWTDGTEHRIITLTVDQANYLYLTKSAVNRQLVWEYSAGGVAQQVLRAANDSLAFMSLGLTWSRSQDTVRAFYNGQQEGADQNGLGVWAGALLPVGCVIGADLIAPWTWVLWTGYLARAVLYDRAFSVAEMEQLHIRQ